MINKITITLSLFLITLASISQVRNYDDSAILFSQENIKGTARFTAMSGAFGALGGNLSAADINPAGLAVFNTSNAAITLDNRNNSKDVSFANITNSNTNNYINFAQGGAALVFDTNNDSWNKFAIGINITLTNDFENDYLIKGNNGFSNQSYFHDPIITLDLYDNVDQQKMRNKTIGTNSKSTFTFAGQYKKNTYFGISLISNSVESEQYVNINENSHDINDNTFSAAQTQSLFTYGDGFSLNFGVITKPFKNIRLGLSYQTPTWYSLTEEFTEDLNINTSNSNSENYTDESVFEYKMQTPSKITGSLAYVFGKKGLISFDYNYKDYSQIKISPTNDFNNENTNLSTNFGGVNEFRIGGEYRLKRLSFRAGYHTEDSIYKNISSLNTDPKSGYSLGFGVKILNNTKLDFSYDSTLSKDNYYYINAPLPAEITKDNKRITATLSFDL